MASFYHFPASVGSGQVPRYGFGLEGTPATPRSPPAVVASTPCAIPGAPLAAVAGREAVLGQSGCQGLQRRLGAVACSLDSQSLFT